MMSEVEKNDISTSQWEDKGYRMTEPLFYRHQTSRYAPFSSTIPLSSKSTKEPPKGYINLLQPYSDGRTIDDFIRELKNADSNGWSYIFHSYNEYFIRRGQRIHDITVYNTTQASTYENHMNRIFLNPKLLDRIYCHSNDVAIADVNMEVQRYFHDNEIQRLIKESTDMKLSWNDRMNKMHGWWSDIDGLIEERDHVNEELKNEEYQYTLRISWKPKLKFLNYLIENMHQGQTDIKYFIFHKQEDAVKYFPMEEPESSEVLKDRRIAFHRCWSDLNSLIEERNHIDEDIKQIPLDIYDKLFGELLISDMKAKEKFLTYVIDEMKQGRTDVDHFICRRPDMIVNNIFLECCEFRYKDTTMLTFTLPPIEPLIRINAIPDNFPVMDYFNEYCGYRTSYCPPTCVAIEKIASVFKSPTDMFKAMLRKPWSVKLHDIHSRLYCKEDSSEELKMKLLDALIKPLPRFLQKAFGFPKSSTILVKKDDDEYDTILNKFLRNVVYWCNKLLKLEYDDDIDTGSSLKRMLWTSNIIKYNVKEIFKLVEVLFEARLRGYTYDSYDAGTMECTLMDHIASVKFHVIPDSLEADHGPFSPKRIKGPIQWMTKEQDLSWRKRHFEWNTTFWREEKLKRTEVTYVRIDKQGKSKDVLTSRFIRTKLSMNTLHPQYERFLKAHNTFMDRWKSVLNREKGESFIFFVNSIAIFVIYRIYYVL